MKTFYYYKALRRTIIQLLDVFNDIQISRYDTNGVITDTFKVPLKFAPKMTAWTWLYEKKDDEMLPIMSMQLNSVEFSPDRLGNRLKRIITSRNIDDGTIEKFLNPIPYNFGFQLSIWSLHMVDVDQILEQILPYFAPYIIMRINITELDATFDVKVIFNGCSPDITNEYTDEERRVLMWNLDFMVHGYLFQPSSDSALIKKIITNYYTNEDSFNDRSTESTFTSAASGESVSTIHTGLGYDADSEILYSYERFGD
uniref:Putative tail sheath stabilizer n=1 Tax=viral metagenome TaxID=1070528 RepID=A0A6M3K7I9_9ZZZZ